MQDVTKDRDKYIGGSDVPIIMGLSPFKTRWQLLREKTFCLYVGLSGVLDSAFGFDVAFCALCVRSVLFSSVSASFVSRHNVHKKR